MKELDELRFVACRACSGPGSPLLCESCLNNRAVISRLKDAVGAVSKVEQAISAVRDAVEGVRSKLAYPKRCTCKKPWYENPECRVHGR